MTSPLRFALLAGIAAQAVPAAAQQAAQATAPPPAGSMTCLPEHAAMGHCSPVPAQPQAAPQPRAARPAGEPAASGTCLPEHAAMGHCTAAPAPPPQVAPQPIVQPSAPTCLPGHAAMGHCTPTPDAKPQKASQPAVPRREPTCLPEHAAMGHCTPPPETRAPAAPQPTVQPTAPICLPEHAAMGHCSPTSPPSVTAAAEGTDLPAGNAPAPPVPVANAADAFYDRQAMEMGRHHLQEFHGGQKLFQVLNNIMEYRGGSGPDGYGWETEGWYGGDINRFWFKTEGEGAFREGVESAEVQGLYSHAIDPYWNLQGGIRYDFRPTPSRAYASVQLEGLAPNFFDIEAALFLSNKGELTARLGGWYDQRITQRLILQPRVEIDLAAQNSREIGVGAGLSEAEFGFRLRYDIRREFAPYVGVQYQRAFGRTARYLRDEGEDVGGFQFLVGVRTWF
jgi:copper resistance protein B